MEPPLVEPPGLLESGAADLKEDEKTLLKLNEEKEEEPPPLVEPPEVDPPEVDPPEKELPTLENGSEKEKVED